MRTIGKLKKFLSSVWYWIKCHCFYRFHILNLKNNRKDDFAYKYGWMDRDSIMFLACFKILEDFVEKEDPRVGLMEVDSYKDPDRDWFDGERESVEHQVNDDKEIRLLYNWWKNEREKEYEDIQALISNIPYKDNIDDVNNWLNQFSGPKWDEYRKRSKAFDDKDEKMLMKLVKIRCRLWT